LSESGPGRIFVRAPDRMSDVIMSIPALRKLGEKHEDVGVDVWCYYRWAPVLEMADLPVEVIPFRGTHAFWRNARWIRGPRYSTAYLFTPALAGGPRGAGCASSQRVHRAGGCRLDQWPAAGAADLCVRASPGSVSAVDGGAATRPGRRAHPGMQGASAALARGQVYGVGRDAGRGGRNGGRLRWARRRSLGGASSARSGRARDRFGWAYHPGGVCCRAQ
jgi:hypothetical protein